jgi:hypothetical protein
LIPRLDAIVIPPAAISQKSEPQAVANGKRIFNQSCAACQDSGDHDF